MERRAIEKLLIQKFNAEARPLSSGALHSLASFVQESNQPANQAVQELLSQLTVGEHPTVTVGDIESLIRKVEEQDSHDDLVQVLNAFDMPRSEWDGAQKRFVRSGKRPSLHAEPVSKPSVILGRLQMIQQTVLRGEQFRGRSLKSSAGSAGLQLTQVKGLVGTTGAARLVLGMLRRDMKNRLVLEDGSGAVPLAGLADADTSAVQGFLPEGACMLVTGEMQASGDFCARAVTEPPVEDRAGAVASLRGLNLSGARPLRPAVVRAVKQQRYADEAKRLVFLSGCYLDDPTVLRAITAIFHGYEHLEEGPPAMFVFIGPFSRAHAKGPTLGSLATQAAFHALAAAISLFPSIQAASKMVFVPAEGDAGDMGVLPQRPLLPSAAEPLAASGVDVTFASNPCRIHFYTKQIVVFASPCLGPFQGRSLIQQPRETEPQEEFRRVCHTVLSQRHLAPFPLAVQPVHWEYDGTLSLFPQPHALVMPMAGLMHSVEMHGVSVDLGTFAAYIPAAPPDGTEVDAAEHDAVEDPEPPEALVEECEVPIEAEAMADSVAGSDAASDTSAEALERDDDFALDGADPYDDELDLAAQSEDDFLEDLGLGHAPPSEAGPGRECDDVSLDAEDL